MSPQNRLRITDRSTGRGARASTGGQLRAGCRQRVKAVSSCGKTVPSPSDLSSLPGMAGAQVEQIRIGKVRVPLDKAIAWVAEYTSPERVNSRNPYSYPAYDEFERDHNEPSRLTDADLLSPGLLNVPVKVRSYYGLLRVRPRLEQALANQGLEVPLEEIESPARIAEMVKPLYAVLDEPGEKPWGVEGTTLSKVLHRKRPQSVVLHDRWVRTCYVGKDAPIPKAKSRSWADYMVAVTLAIRDDLCAQPDHFKVLDEATSCPGRLSAVRLLDIVAWKSKGDSA